MDAPHTVVHTSFHSISVSLSLSSTPLLLHPAGTTDHLSRAFSRSLYLSVYTHTLLQSVTCQTHILVTMTVEEGTAETTTEVGEILPLVGGTLLLLLHRW
jgi:hypothetical protein